MSTTIATPQPPCLCLRVGVGVGGLTGAQAEPGQEEAELPTSGRLSSSVYEKGEDLVIQEVATRPLTQDLLREEVRQAWPRSPHPPPSSTGSGPPLTSPTLAPRTATSWTRGASRSTCGRDASLTTRRKRPPSAGLW